MPRDYDVKINRSTMTIMISSGLTKQSRNRFPFLHLLFSNSIFLGPNQTNAEKPRGLQFKPQNKSVSFVCVLLFYSFVFI
jgi:hypothetical protein